MAEAHRNERAEDRDAVALADGVDEEVICKARDLI